MIERSPKQHCGPSIKTMTLGGAQFGMEYGIANGIGRIELKDSIEIIRHAITEGIEYIDTAAAYGDSEKIIGKALQGGWSGRVNVITKILPIKGQDINELPGDYWPLQVRNSILNSCVNLNASVIHTVMLHRANQLTNKSIIEELISLKREGIIKKIGVSVQNLTELELALMNEQVSIIQMPFNILDYRWDPAIANLQSARKERGIVVHARSAMLQGLLCTDDSIKWESAGIFNSEEIVSWLNQKYKQHGKMSVPDLCIGYVNSQEWIDSVVVGVDSKANLFSNLQSISMPLLSDKVIDDLINSRPKVSEDSLDPSNWKKLCGL